MTAEAAAWIPLESNPEAFNKYVEIMGVKGVECHELLGFEPELIDFVPGPHLALIFCYPYQAKANAFLKNIYGQLAESGYVKPKWAFFMQQNIRNACGTFALFHSLLNNIKRIDIEGSEFGEWFGLTKQDGAEGANLLANNSKLAALHEHCALNASETNVPDKVDYHFISYIVHDGRLFEFDSMQEFPRDCGPSSDDTFLADVGTVCKELMGQLETISCNAIVLSAKED
uniref:Ubiquitin carboxyl-terminal hydrolase n=1 Tax=Globodera rostochiensis TaxID=31243 RepID=A0A914H7A4_GLORO